MVEYCRSGEELLALQTRLVLRSGVPLGIEETFFAETLEVLATGLSKNKLNVRQL